MSLTIVGWMVLAVVVLGALVVFVRYFASVAVELTRVLLVVGIVAVVAFVLWALFF